MPRGKAVSKKIVGEAKKSPKKSPKMKWLAGKKNGGETQIKQVNKIDPNQVNLTGEGENRSCKCQKTTRDESPVNDVPVKGKKTALNHRSRSMSIT